jgi:hypothetical protein
MKMWFRLAPIALFGSLAAPAGAATWIVPAVFDGPGANGVVFSTDITLVNPDGIARSVAIVPILPPGGFVADPFPVLLAPGESRRIPNPVSGLGGLRVLSDGGVFVSARANTFFPTLGPQPPATRGTALPVTEQGSLLRAGEIGHAIWISQSADRSKGERTNVGVVFSEPGTATVTVYGPSGAVLGSQTFDAARAAAMQTPLDAIVSGDVPLGRIAVAVTRGSALAYAGSVDNATGDLAIVAAERLSVGRTAGGPVDLVSSGVAQTAGRNGAVWHTDARFANPGPAPVRVVAYLRTPDEETILPGTLTVSPGQTVEVPDVVQSLFNVSTATTGSILWRASAPLAIGTRTRSSNGAATTASSISAAVAVERFPGAADAPGALADLRNDPQFRTNLQAASGPGGATFTVDLFDEAGNAVGSARETLPPLSWTQWPLDQLVPGAALPARSRARVTIESGSALVSANVVENRTSDPVPTQVPLGAAASTGPAVPVGTWGAAPNGMDHVIVDSAGISVFLPCRSGNFPQPLSLDANGRFAVLGTWYVTQGPTVAYDAILTGQTDGHSLSFTVTAGNAFDTITAPETVSLGGAWGPFTGLCPIEY